MTPLQPRSVHRLIKVSMLASSDRRAIKTQPSPSAPLIISASELRDFLRCRVKHHWRHQARLIPVGGAPALDMGTLVHVLLEQWYTLPFKGRTVSAMSKLAKKLLGQTTPASLTIEDLELIRAMVIGYADWAQEEDRAIGLVQCTPEQWFDLPLTDDGSIRVRGKIDNVFAPKEFKRTIGCHEYKTRSQIRVDAVELNLQLSVYLWALRELNPKQRRYIAYFNILRKQLPGPRVRSELFHREAVERTDDEIAQWKLDAARAALDMLDGAVYPNPTDSCSWDCDFKLPCLMRGRPVDLKQLLAREYKPKEG